MAEQTMQLVGVVWAWGVGVGKAVQHFKPGLTRHPIRNMGDSGAESYLNLGAWFKRFQGKRVLVCVLETILVTF